MPLRECVLEEAKKFVVLAPLAPNTKLKSLVDTPRLVDSASSHLRINDGLKFGKLSKYPHPTHGESLNIRNSLDSMKLHL